MKKRERKLQKENKQKEIDKMTILENEENEIMHQIKEVKEQRKKLDSEQLEGAPPLEEMIKELRIARLRAELGEERRKLEKSKRPKRAHLDRKIKQERWWIERKEKILKWEKHLKQAFTTHEILLVIEKAPKEVKEEAWKKFLRQNPSNYELFLVIEKAPEQVKEKAWERFLEQNPDKHDLDLVITFAPDKYKTKAQEVLQVLKKEIYV